VRLSPIDAGTSSVREAWTPIDVVVDCAAGLLAGHCDRPQSGRPSFTEDFALRRRFHAFEMRPSRDVLESYLKARNEDTDLVLRFFDLVQERVASPDYAPGHSYWMTEDLSPQGLSRVWRYELYPYLAEYWFEHRSYLDDLNDKVSRLLAEEA
jgi:hypothetical protein